MFVKQGTDRILPCSSTYLRAFSKKDGVPSISSNASKTGRPRTRDLGDDRSFAAVIKEIDKINSQINTVNEIN